MDRMSDSGSADRSSNLLEGTEYGGVPAFTNFNLKEMKAYVFPGQGAQFPGMAKDIYEGSPKAKELLERANEILGFRITDVMFEGSADDLKQTAVTQPAVFLHSYVAYACNDVEAPDMVAGHSLGEFSALAASGALDFEDALKLVSLRAKAMQKACGLASGTMAAIIGLPASKVEEICASVDGVVVAANYNNEIQIVISGETEAVRTACTLMKEAGAKRALELQVSGAFHSPLMEPARAELAQAIESVTFKTPSCPVYQNFTAKASSDPAVIKENLLKQLTGPVMWTQSVKEMVAAGATEFVEFGPGTVLQGLVAKICPGAGLAISGVSGIK